jgi:hypothetical protein
LRLPVNALCIFDARLDKCETYMRQIV